MKLVLSENDGTVVEIWDSYDGLDLAIFYNLGHMEDVAEVTQIKLLDHCTKQLAKLSS